MADTDATRYLFIYAEQNRSDNQMEMRRNIHIPALLLVILASLLCATNHAAAQVDTVPAKRLRGSATVRGVIGGESHDSYLIHARKGQRLTVRISWRHEGENRAEFTVGDTPDFGGEVEFGRESDHGRRWSGRIPKTGDYHIYVTGYPTARYTLKVTLK
jgi:hypothetical protein